MANKAGDERIANIEVQPQGVFESFSEAIVPVLGVRSIGLEFVSETYQTHTQFQS